MPARPLLVAVDSEQPIVRRGLESLLTESPGFSVVDLHAQHARLDGPEVVLHDVVRPRPRDERVLPRVGAAPVVAVAPHDRPELAQQALDAGAVATISLAVTAAQLGRVLVEVAAGREAPVGAGVPGLGGAARVLAVSLSTRETEVVGLVARGWSNQDIADHLYVSTNTIKTYIRSAYRKMGVGSRSQAVLWALREGLA